MSETREKPTVHGMFAFFGEMVWTIPGERLGAVDWRLRYAQVANMSDRLVAASVLEAYEELIRMPEKRRRVVVRGIREAMKMSEAKNG